jgi:CRP-like cAMP-binding protein
MTENLNHECLNQVYSDRQGLDLDGIGLKNLGRADEFIDEILEIAPDISLFDDFSEDEIRMVCHYMGCFAVPRGYALVADGIPRGLSIMLTGTAEIRQISAEGCEVVSELAPGSIIGEVSMSQIPVLDSQSNLISCITTKPVDVTILTPDGLNGILTQAPRLGNKLLLALLQLLSRRLHESSKRSLPSIA